MRVRMISLGCSKNRVDSEYMLGNLAQAGIELVSEGEAADAVIVNTCSFLESACDEAIEVILECAREKREGKVGALLVAGCLPNRFGGEILESMPEIDGIISPGEYGRIAELVGKAGDGRVVSLLGDRGYLGKGAARLLTNSGHYAYLKICDGCDNRCSYCMIPDIRGKLVSKPFEEVVAEAEDLVGRGVKELVIIAQDTTVYGQDLYGKPRLAELLRRLADIEGLMWLRLMYAYPERVDDELVGLFKDGLGGKLAAYIDLPMQHGSDAVLRAMNRLGSAESMERLVRRLRQARPEMVVRTTFMVGFPGETKEDFEELLRFVGRVRPQRAGVFRFSPEEGTPAAAMPSQVPEALKLEREARMMGLLAEISRQFNQSRIGEEADVIVDGPSEESELLVDARSYAEAPEEDGKIFVGDAGLPAGSVVRVRIESASDYDLGAQVLA